MNSKLVLLGLMIGATVNGCPVLGAEEAPSVHLRMTKDRYGTNEPIGIVIVFDNPTDQPLRVMLNKPTYRFEFGCGRFKFEDDRIRARKEFSSVQIISCTSVLKFIPPKGQLKAILYLQRFYEQPSAGSYTMSFSFRYFGHLIKANDVQESIDLKSEGKLKFSVVATSITEQRAMLDSLLKQIREEKDDQKRQDKVEAISVVEDAMVVPYLVKIAIQGHLRLYSIYGALSRFSNDKKALAILAEALESKEPSMSPMEILTLLCRWRYRLSPQQIQHLRGSGDKAVEEKLQEYLKLVNDDLKKTD